MSLFEAGQRHGIFWGIGTRTPAGAPACLHYSNELIGDRIEGIRTDLDTFSDAEQAVLQNHGYLEVNSLVRRRDDQLPGMLPTPLPQCSPPFPVWLDETRVRIALKNADKRKLLFGHR